MTAVFPFSLPALPSPQVQALRKHGTGHWKTISDEFGGARTPRQVERRWRFRHRDRGLSPTAWSAKQTRKLQTAVLRHSAHATGIVDWTAVVASVCEGDEARTEDQCMEHWTSLIKDDKTLRKVGKWTDEEDKKLKVRRVSLMSSVGFVGRAHLFVTHPCVLRTRCGTTASRGSPSRFSRSRGPARRGSA